MINEIYVLIGSMMLVVVQGTYRALSLSFTHTRCWVMELDVWLLHPVFQLLNLLLKTQRGTTFPETLAGFELLLEWSSKVLSAIASGFKHGGLISEWWLEFSSSWSPKIFKRTNHESWSRRAELHHQFRANINGRLPCNIEIKIALLQ